jgi:hypothetical protein
MLHGSLCLPQPTAAIINQKTNLVATFRRFLKNDSKSVAFIRVKILALATKLNHDGM